MTIRLVALLVLAILVSVLEQTAAAQSAPSAPYIVTFDDAAPLAVFPAGRLNAQARANPVAWSYLDRAVLGAVQELEREYGFRADHVYSATVRGFAARLTAAQVDMLRGLPFVAFIEADAALESFEQVLPWGVQRIGGNVSSTLAGDGSGDVANVNIYVLDNGVDLTHADLNVINHVNFTSGSNSASCAHGTRVSGVLAARDNTVDVVGVAPGARITAVKVTSCDPVITSISTAVKGVDWVTANAVRPAVANMSIGGLASRTLDDAVKRSADKGVFYVVAAGNSGRDACLTSPQRAGTHAGVMTVAATTQTDEEASWSNYGRCVDIWAPGSEILTTELGGGTVTSSGTSYAAPHVGGTAALYLSTYSGATPADVEAAIKAHATTTGTLSKDGRAVKLVYVGAY